MLVYAAFFASHCEAAGAAHKCKNPKWPKNEVCLRIEVVLALKGVNFTGVRPFWPLKTQNFFWWARRARAATRQGAAYGRASKKGASASDVQGGGLHRVVSRPARLPGVFFVTVIRFCEAPC